MATEKMFWTKKTNDVKDFDTLMRRISALDADVAKLNAQLAAMDTKIEAYRFEVKNLTKKRKEALKQDMQDNEEEATNINNPVILPYNGTFK